ncbi:MauE/DoxX family redox-associated membrane protein [Nonomuraea sediminis]|uniref:MauE/DoxX family redox-associated membrane protein n=1 Tax=Nonomuraea sediminis TaxID=2835864 RepID=UPI001BDD7805|nr:MauE/DoxX family redox-associated membrane protein [Nonomuraea sediminis]
MIHLAVAAGFLIAAVFLTSAFSKVRSKRQFELFTSSAVELGLPSFIPPRLGAAALVAAEAAVPLLLLTFPVAGFCLAVALLAAFITGIVRVHRAGERVACRCFGDSRTPLGPRHVVRNALLIAVALAGALTASSSAEGTNPAFVIASAGVGLIGSVVFILFDDISDLFAMRRL